MNPADSRSPVAAPRTDLTRGKPLPNYYNVEVGTYTVETTD